MEEEYILKYTGEETDALLKHTESLKDQTTAEDGETVQVYDESGIPHKIAKTELLNKAILATTSIQDISKFIAINEAGDAVGIMTLEQITEVFRKEFAKFPSSSETSAVVAVNKEGDALELMSNEKLAQVVGGLIGTVTTEKSGLVDKNTGLFQRDFYSGDLNNFINGYTLFSGGTNVPVSGFYGIVEALNCGGYILQRAYNAANHKVYERVLWDAWRPWVALN